MAGNFTNANTNTRIGGWLADSFLFLARVVGASRNGSLFRDEFHSFAYTHTHTQYHWVSVSRFDLASARCRSVPLFVSLLEVGCHSSWRTVQVSIYFPVQIEYNTIWVVVRFRYTILL